MLFDQIRAPFRAFSILLACLPTATAHAALGDIASSTDGTSVARTLAGGAASVRTAVDAGGTTINAYVSTATGRVFGYTWQGPTMPDLHALLGSYSALWNAEAARQFRENGSGLHAARFEQASVIVESGGRMHGYIGRAWLPGALPTGVTAIDLR